MTALDQQHGLSFVELVAPIPVEAFFADIWEKRVKIVSRQDPDHFRGLITTDDVDAAIASMGLSFPDLRLVNAAGTPEPQAYTRPDGRIIPASVMQLFADGCTIVLNQQHRRLNRLGEFCRALESEFGLPFQTNIYLSPPNAGGFKVHFDTHDVFVLQLEGYKNWSLYESPLALPLPGQHHDETPVQPGPPTKTFRLNQGDLIYIPRGVYHSATAGDVQSLHVTLGALSKTWAELFVEVVAEVSARDIEFRRALPIGFGTGRANLEQARVEFDRLVERLATHADFERVASAMAHEFVRSRDAGARGQLFNVGALARVGLDTMVVARPNLLHLLEEEGDRVVLQLAQRAIEFPGALRKSVAQLLAGQAVRVAEIVGPIDDPGRIVLARRLIKEGVLALAET